LRTWNKQQTLGMRGKEVIHLVGKIKAAAMQLWCPVRCDIVQFLAKTRSSGTRLLLHVKIDKNLVNFW